MTLSFLSRLGRDLSLSAVTAGFVAVMVSYAGPCVIVLAAAKAADLSQDQISSWIWSISIGSGICGVLLSAWYRAPIVAAWSTPGAALLVGSFGLYSYSEAIGAFLVSSIMITVLGITGLFSRFIRQIPTTIVTAMLAGILFQFGTSVFTAAATAPCLALPMIVIYLVLKRFKVRCSILIAMLVGLAIAFIERTLPFGLLDIALTQPLFEMPIFTWGATVGLAIPLCIVAVTSQNAPGMAVLKASGYGDVPASPLITVTGLASIMLAPFGAHGINLAAITAAICTGPEAHEDVHRRYVAGIACGGFYLVIGSFGAAVASLFAHFPRELIAVVGGMALFASIAASLATAMKDEETREAALVGLLVASSGVTLFGIGAAFWALIAGVGTNFILNGARRRDAVTESPFGRS